MTTDKTTLSPEIEAAVHMAESLGWDIDPDGDGRGIAELAQIVGAAASMGRKTLADVKPGGMVMLGDQAAREGFEAWPQAREFEIQKDGSGEYLSEVTHGAWLAWQHLSAHPSPGGQDALHEAARRVISDIDSGDYGGTISMATYDALVAALAARQPVGEPEIWVSPGQLEELKRRPAGQGSNYLPTRLASEGNFTRPLYAAPPAQAVDLGQFREAVAWAYHALGNVSHRGPLGELLALIDGKAVGK